MFTVTAHDLLRMSTHLFSGQALLKPTSDADISASLSPCVALLKVSYCTALAGLLLLAGTVNNYVLVKN